MLIDVKKYIVTNSYHPFKISLKKYLQIGFTLKSITTSNEYTGINN